MQVTRPLYSLANSISKRTGFFSKRQCVDVATRLGKELVDMKNAGIEINRNACMYVVKKYVPNADFKLFWGNKEIMESGDAFIKNYVESSDSERLMGCYMKYPNILLLTDGAIRKDVEIEAFSHEFQHYMYSNTTPLLGSMTKAKRHNDPYDSQKFANRLGKNPAPSFEKNLKDLLYHCKGNIRTRKDLMKYYAENTNINSKKRLNAYITSICRYHFGKSSCGNVPLLISELIHLKNELNSYIVMDSIVEYKDKAAPGHMQSVLLYKEAMKTIKREIFKMLIHQHPICSGKQLADRKLPSPMFK